MAKHRLNIHVGPLGKANRRELGRKFKRAGFPGATVGTETVTVDVSARDCHAAQEKLRHQWKAKHGKAPWFGRGGCTRRPSK